MPATASASVPTPVLDAIHRNVGYTNHARYVKGYPRVAYHWYAEAHPQSRERILAQWQHFTYVARHAPYAPPVVAIRTVFGGYSGQAISVAWCESRLSIYAVNGQYRNLFQMGSSERARYGWHDAGSPPVVAARSARRYFDASGRDWSPWECKP